MLNKIKCGDGECVYEHLPSCCKFPTCKPEDYQKKLADQIYRELISGEPEDKDE